MKSKLALAFALVAVPAFAQTSTEAEAPDAGDTGLSERLGTVFYADDTMTTLRPADEIEAQWSTVSPEDQAAILERCAALTAGGETAPTTGGADATATGDSGAAAGTEGSADATGTAAGGETAPTTGGADATGTGDAGAAAGTEESSDGSMAMMDFTQDDAQMRPICDIVGNL